MKDHSAQRFHHRHFYLRAYKDGSNSGSCFKPSMFKHDVKSNRFNDTQFNERGDPADRLQINRFKLKTWGNLPFTSEEFIEYTPI